MCFILLVCIEALQGVVPLRGNLSTQHEVAEKPAIPPEIDADPRRWREIAPPPIFSAAWHGEAARLDLLPNPVFPEWGGEAGDDDLLNFPYEYCGVLEHIAGGGPANAGDVVKELRGDPDP
jgi:hypothetical protein